MNIFDSTVLALNYSAFVYLLAAIAFFFGISTAGSKRIGRWSQVASWLIALAFLLHTYGLAGRWVIGGIDRPPWTNLYESLVFFAWGVALFQLIAQWKWKLPIVGSVSTPLVFLLMGMSVMTPNKLVEPLLPSLQSNWLKIHVVFGMVAYAGFTISACFAFLQLMRNGVSLKKIVGGFSCMVLLNLFIAGARDLSSTGQFQMQRTVLATGADGVERRVKDQYVEYQGGDVITRMEVVPGANIFFALSGLFFGALLLPLFGRGNKFPDNPTAEEAYKRGMDLEKRDWLLLGGGFLSFLGLLGSISWAVYSHESLTLQSNPYLFLLLVMTAFFVFMFFFIIKNYKNFLQALPEASRLDELGYKNILFAFPFQTLLLITGAIWAYYAWGRSWGWDPKEVGALVTWIAYLIYLHGKLLMGWRPNWLSALAILSFLILVFAFLGVNLVLSGLHSYGSA